MTAREFERITGRPLAECAHQCHSASLSLVRSGELGPCRVARGTCDGVGGQHSWVVLGMNCYDPEAEVVDPTLWSYAEDVEGVWRGRASERPHLPFGYGSIWDWGRPEEATEEPLELDPPVGGWSPAAQAFLDLLGPLDFKGWVQLAHAPVEQWPSAEILGAMYHDPRLGGRIPIDIVGMATDINPAGLYLR